MHGSHPDALFHVVKVRYSEAELDALQHEVFTLVYGYSPSGSIRADDGSVATGVRTEAWRTGRGGSVPVVDAQSRAEGART